MRDHFVVLVVVLITPPHGQPHTVFGGFISVSRVRMLLCKEPIMAEDSPHITMQCVTTFFSNVALVFF